MTLLPQPSSKLSLLDEMSNDSEIFNDFTKDDADDIKFNA